MSLKTPALGEKYRNSPPKNEELTGDIVVESDEYRDDDFESSAGSNAVPKVTVSASGKLPPLSGSYPYGADEKSLSQSFQQSSHRKDSSQGKSGRDQMKTSQEKSSGGLGGLHAMI